MKRRALLLSFAAAGLFISGCHPPWLRRPTADVQSIVFPTPPTKEQIIGAINSNSSRIYQLQSDATIRVHGFGLRGNLALERPKRLRLRAGLLGLPGTGVDLGSNDDIFWLWFEQNRPPGVYYSRHDQFAYSPARQMIPVEPTWLIEALGVVELEPSGLHEGPFRTGPGKLEIHSRVQTGSGELTKVTVVDDQYGRILEQQVRDPRGQVIASARASKHRYYPQAGVTLPQHVDVKIGNDPNVPLAFSIDVGTYQINQLAGTDQLWSMPRPDGFPLIDLADPNVNPFAQAQTLRSAERYSPYEGRRNAFRPRYRRVFR